MEEDEKRLRERWKFTIGSFSISVSISLSLSLARPAQSTFDQLLRKECAAREKQALE